MKKYKFSDLELSWWAEYQVDGMQNQDNQTVLAIKSQVGTDAVNPTDLSDTMVALGLPNHNGYRFTHVEFLQLAAAKNLNLVVNYENEEQVRLYVALDLQTTPTFSPVAGAVAAGATITIASASADAIYYTTDGSIPTILSTNQDTTACVLTTGNELVRAIAVKDGMYTSLIGEAQYSQALAAAPTAVVLAVGSTEPVGGVTNVAIPANGAIDNTGKVTGWATGTADKIKITVTNAASTASSMTIDGDAYVSGADYTIAAVGTLEVVLTTTRANYVTTVRTFTIDVAAAV